MKLKKFNDIFPSDSLLEGRENYPYRFKTEREFIKEYGENWFEIIVPQWNSTGDMDYLFGTVYPYMEDELNKDYYKPTEKTLEDEFGNDWAIGWEMLTKNTPIVPSYLPKSKRVLERSSLLEGMKHYPYRFKTEEEFYKEFGRNWMNVICPTWNHDMDEFFGKEYPFMEDEMDKENYKPRNERFPDSNGEDWAISWEMLTKNEPKVPNYKPRKLYIEE